MPGILGPLADGGGWNWLFEGPCTVTEFLPERGDLAYCPPPLITAALRDIVYTSSMIYSTRTYKCMRLHVQGK